MSNGHHPQQGELAGDGPAARLAPGGGKAMAAPVSKGASARAFAQEERA